MPNASYDAPDSLLYGIKYSRAVSKYQNVPEYFTRAPLRGRLTPPDCPVCAALYVGDVTF